MGCWLLLLLLTILATLATITAAEELSFAPHFVERNNVRPGEWLFIDLRLYHDGGAACETAVVRAINPPASWGCMLNATVGGEVVTSTDALELPVLNWTPTEFRLTLLVPDTAIAGLNYFNLNACIKDRPEVNHSISIYIWVTHVPGASLSLHDPAQGDASGHPGDAVELVLNLTNLGNGWDRFQMGMTVSGPGSTWQMFWSGGVGTDAWTSNIAPHASYAVGFTVWVPEDGLVGDHVNLTITALSAEAPASSPPPVSMSVACGFSGWLEVSSAFYDTDLDPSLSHGGSATLQGSVLVNNLGNGADTVVMEGSVLGLTDTGLATFHALPGQLRIERLDSATFSIALEVYSFTPAGIHTLSLRFRSRDPSVLATDLVVFQVREVPGVCMTCPNPVQVVAPGAFVQFDLVVTNSGNFKTSYDLSVALSPEGWVTQVRPSSILLEAGKSGPALLSITMPAMDDQMLLTTYNLKVMASHERENLRSYYTLVVLVEPTYRMDWCVGGAIVTSHDAPYAPTDALGEMPTVIPYCDDPDWESTGLTVMNRGNVVANMSLSVWLTSISVNVTFEPATALLSPGEIVSVTVRFVARHDLDPGAYVITLALYCRDDPSFRTRILPIQFMVVFLDVAVQEPLRVHLGPTDVIAAGPVTVRPSARIGLEATIRNLHQTPVTDVEVVLVHTGPTGPSEELNRTTVRLASFEAIHVNFTWSSAQLGEHSLGIEVRLPNQTRDDNDAAWVVLEVKAGDGDGDDRGWGPMPEDLPVFAVAIALVVVLLGLRARASIARGRRPPRGT